MQLISADAIKSWANCGASAQDIGWLIRRLVKASCVDWSVADFLDGAETCWGGFDGIVNCGGIKPFVPAGRSMWELSARQDVKSKATSDYSQRTVDTDRDQRVRASFVFATPRAWKGKEDWEKERHEEKRWLAVSALDATSLASWLEHAPGVASHFARRYLGFEEEDVISGQEVWERYTEGSLVPTGRAIGPSFVIAGRTDLSREISRWCANEVRDGEDILVVQGSSVVEIAHFVRASIEEISADEGERDRLVSRLVWIRSARAVPWLEVIASPHIVLSDSSLTPHIRQVPRRRRCKGIVMQTANSAPNLAVWEEPERVASMLYLPPVSEEQRVAELCGLGMTEEGASLVCKELGTDYARLCRGGHAFGLIGLGR
jgi:hypothetical protein